MKEKNFLHELLSQYFSLSVYNKPHAHHAHTVICDLMPTDGLNAVRQELTLTSAAHFIILVDTQDATKILSCSDESVIDMQVMQLHCFKVI